MTPPGYTDMPIKPIHWAVLAFIGMLVCAVYGQMYGHDFIYFDDDTYVLNNPHVITGLSVENIRWSLTSIELANWHPLTYWSHQLDSTLFGKNAGAHRLSNLLLHLVCIGLVFETFRQITKSAWTGLFIAAAFGLHPVNVEVVAWIAQRKTLLSTVFTMLTILAYLRYVAAPSPTRYGLILLWLALSLMSKPMAVTTPLLLLILDFWPLNRLKGCVDLSSPLARRPHDPSEPVKIIESSDKIVPALDLKAIPGLIVEKIPMLILVMLVAGVTRYAQQMATSSLTLITPLDRAANACQGFVLYLKMAIWPFDLAILYPFSKPSLLTSFLALALLVAISFAILRFVAGLPFLLTGWLWYLVSLVPVIGLVQVGSQSHADRYAYTPLLGIWLMIGMSLPMLLRGRLAHDRIILKSAGAAFICLMAWATYLQAGHWQNTKTLFKHALEVTEKNYTAYSLYGTVLFDEKKYEEAAQYFLMSLQISARQPNVYRLLAVSLMHIGRMDLAFKVIDDGLKLYPDHPESLFVLARLQQQAGQQDQALKTINRFIKLSPSNGPALQLKGLLLFSAGQFEQALEPLEASQAMQPDNADTAYLRAMSLLQLGRQNDALAPLQFAASHRKDTYSRLNLGLLYNSLQKPDQAVIVFTPLIAQQPDLQPARLGLARAHLALGDKDQARLHAQAAIKLNPQDPQALKLMEQIDKAP